jgi:hypothetical protein
LKKKESIKEINKLSKEIKANWKKEKEKKVTKIKVKDERKENCRIIKMNKIKGIFQVKKRQRMKEKKMKRDVWR